MWFAVEQRPFPVANLMYKHQKCAFRGIMLQYTQSFETFNKTEEFPIIFS